MEPSLPSETIRLSQRAPTPSGTDCPYLQRESLENTGDSDSEVVSLKLEVSRIDDHIGQLQQRKQDRLRRLNDLCSATRNLPPETLILIFHYVATPITYSTFLDYSRKLGFPKDMERNTSIIRTASVCTLWRDLILSTPSLWTTLVLHIRPNNGQVNKELMELSWTRSQELPLAVDLGFKGSQDSDGVTWEVKAIELFSMVRSNADRLGILRLRNPPSSQVRHIIKSSLHQLQCLALENLNDPRAIALSNLPQLRQLTLRSIWTKIRVTHNDITVLDFFDTSLAVCIGIFKRCPNAVEVHCRFPKIPPEEVHNEAGPKSIITFPLLENFTWILSDTDLNMSFISRIALPKLKALQLHGDMNRAPRSISPSPVFQFLNQLSRGVQELELVYWKEWTSGGLAQLFGHVYNTKKLVLRECFETFNLDMARLLSLAQTGSVNEPEYLPRLEMLSIQSAKTRAYLELLPDLMKQRALKSNRIQPFRLEVSRPGEFTEQLLEAVAAVRDGNVKLKFLEIF